MVVRASSVDLDPEVFQACLVDLSKFCSSNQSKSRSDEEDAYWDEEEEQEHENGMTCLADNLNQLQVYCYEFMKGCMLMRENLSVYLISLVIYYNLEINIKWAS